ncbi:unnamed protein product [marine sediment metagenome]|uniref:Uncharacterized protein n=1 Tax=marine sediment metagenome TaxID=412755 RepID=X0UIJ8_9ZZZZ
MMGLETIRKVNEEKCQQAEKSGLLPKVILGKTTIEEIKSIPHIGDFRPDGFELVATHFVDNSGFGGEHEPALTFKQFMNQIEKGHAYAIIEAGQFQIHIGEFEVRK